MTSDRTIPFRILPDEEIGPHERLCRLNSIMSGGAEACPNSQRCSHLTDAGYIDLYFCFCAIKRAFPTWCAPREHNPKTVGMILPVDDEQMMQWSVTNAHGMSVRSAADHGGSTDPSGQAGARS